MSLTNCSYRIVTATDTLILIEDQVADCKVSVTNDAKAVITELSQALGGIGSRDVYYKDSGGRFDQMLVKNESFIGFGPGTQSQQKFLRSLINN